MEVKFEITEEDYIQFNLIHIQNSPSQKKMYHLLRYAIPLLFTIPIYIIGTMVFNQPRMYWMIIAVFFALIWMITYPKQYKKLIEKQTKKLLKEGDNSSIFGEKTMVIDEEDITVFSEFTSEKVAKNSIKDIKISDDLILIYLSGISAQIIPTRYLNDESRKHLLARLNYNGNEEF